MGEGGRGGGGGVNRRRFGRKWEGERRRTEANGREGRLGEEEGWKDVRVRAERNACAYVVKELCTVIPTKSLINHPGNTQYITTVRVFLSYLLKR